MSSGTKRCRNPANPSRSTLYQHAKWRNEAGAGAEDTLPIALASDNTSNAKGKNRATGPSQHVHFEHSEAEEVELPGLGDQYKSRDKELQFEPEDDDMHNVGLKNIHIVSIHSFIFDFILIYIYII